MKVSISTKRKPLFRSAAVLVVTLAALLAGAATASAQGGPTVEQFRFTGVDDSFSAELSANCGFAITVNADSHETHIFSADGSEQDLIHYTAAYEVGGQTKLSEDDNFRLLISSSGSVFVSGADYRLVSAGGVTLLKNSGNLSFTPPDQLAFHGPHPSITSGFDLCAYLAS
jgi:hypothetical protein